MSLKYTVQKNNLSQTPNEYYARPYEVPMHNRDEIVKRCAIRNPAFNEANYRAMMETLDNVYNDVKINGEGVNDGIVHATPTIKGNIQGKDGHVGPDNKVEYNMKTTTVFSTDTEKIKLEKVEGQTTDPNIESIKDTESGKTNSTITPGGTIELVGYRLNVLPAETPDNLEGVYFISVADGAETRQNKYTLNYPKQLVTSVPSSLSAGEVFIEIRTYSTSGSTVGKKLKTGRFSGKLTVK